MNFPFPSLFGSFSEFHLIAYIGLLILFSFSFVFKLTHSEKQSFEFFGIHLPQYLWVHL